MQASCRRCTLFVQQTHKAAVFDRIEAHPCLGREQPVPEGAGVHPSHIMANVGRAWICKRCFMHLWVSYEKIPPGVTQLCRPSRQEARAGGGQLAPFLPAEHRPSWLQMEQQPTTVPPRTKNRGRAKSGPPSSKEPPKMHTFFTTPPPPLPAATCPPQDLGSREVGSKQQHYQPQASQPHTQPETTSQGSRHGRELEVLQAGSSQSSALHSPPPRSLRVAARVVEGTRPPLPLPSFLHNGLGLGMGVVSPLPRMAMEMGLETRQPRMELQEHWDGTAAASQEEQGGQAVGSQGSASQDWRGKKQTKPSAIRQDRELEAAYQKVAAHRAQQRPDAPRLSRSSYMRNRSRPPKAVRQAKGGGKDSSSSRSSSSGSDSDPGQGLPPRWWHLTRT